jgi:epoxide hydrolase-like predicted phosphatase
MSSTPVIRAVYWDVGGVILRTIDHTPRERLAARLGTTHQALDELVFASEIGRKVQLGQAGVARLWEHVAQTFGLSPEGLAAFQEDFWGGDRLDAELVDYIRSLRPRCRTGVISNGWPNLRENLRARWGIADAFDAIVVSAEAGVMKPDLRIYQLALERLEVRPAQAVFVDDFIENVEGARRAGMLAVHFRDPHQARDAVEAILNGG